MLGKPIHEIQLSEIQEFLETGIREGTTLDFKGDFPSNLEKTLAAFANTYGGIIFIGVDETKLGAAKLPITGVELRSGLRERILQKGLEAIDPPVLPDVHVIPFASNPALSEPDRALIIVEVAESPDAPHAVDSRTVVYLRGDNVSKHIDRKATIGEIEWFLNKRQKSLDLKNLLLDHSRERAEKMRDGRRSRHRTESYPTRGEMTLTLSPVFPRSPLLSAPELFRASQECRVDFNTAIRQLPAGAPRRMSDGVFFDGDYAYSEYQTMGGIFHQSDYWWDYYTAGTSPGRRHLYPGCTASILLATFANAAEFYSRADYCGSLEFRFMANGLDNAHFTSPTRGIFETYYLTESHVRIERTFSVAQLREKTLELAKDCQREIYWAFGYDAQDRWLEEDFLDG